MTRTARMAAEPRFGDEAGGTSVGAENAPEAVVNEARLGLLGATAHNFDAPRGFGDLRRSLTTRWMVRQR